VSERRELSFSDWDAVLADLRQLANGYEQHGNWDLKQTAEHLNDWLRFPMDGFPKAPLPMACLMFCLRVTMGPSMLRKIIATGKMKDGIPTAPDTVHDRSADAAATAAAVAQLEQSIARFQTYTGPIHRSPVFGDMDKATAEGLQLAHFGHHLSWLSPTA
jgi:hypothetical protein